MVFVDIKIYTKKDCPLCEETKEMLRSNQMPFTEIVIGKDITREEVLAQFPGLKMAPIILVDNCICPKEYLAIAIIAAKTAERKENNNA